MSKTCESPPGGEPDGPSEVSLLGSDDARENTKSPSAVQAAIVYLQRDFVAECLRIAALKAGHAADDVAIGDDDCAERSIRIAINNLREAASGFRTLQGLADRGAS
jgi:hypothetical protein